MCLHFAFKHTAQNTVGFSRGRDRSLLGRGTGSKTNGHANDKNAYHDNLLWIEAAILGVSTLPSSVG